MKQVKLIDSADLEKLNMNELTQVVGGVNANTETDSSHSEVDSQYRDSDNNDTFQQE